MVNLNQIIMLIILSYNNCKHEIRYENKSICIGYDKLKTIKELFNNNLNIDNAKRYSSISQAIKYVDIKEKSICYGKIAITPTFFFDFSKRDSTLINARFIFLTDNKITRKQQQMIFNLISNKLSVLKKYVKSGKNRYRINGIKILVEKKNLGDGIQLSVKAEL